MKMLRLSPVRVITSALLTGFVVVGILAIIGAVITLWSLPCYAATESEALNSDWSGYNMKDVKRILHEDITEESLMTLEQKQDSLICDMRGFYEHFNEQAVGIKYEALCAISALETGYFRSDVCKRLNNVGGITSSSGYASYATIEDGIEAFSNLLLKEYLDLEGCYYEGKTIIDVSKHYNRTVHWINLYVKIRLDMEHRSGYSHEEALQLLQEEQEPEPEAIKLPCINPVSIDDVHMNMFALDERMCII